MKETFNELGDLDILAAATTHSDMTRYDEAVKLDYYFRIDPDQSWGEWFGEIGSPRNLLALGLGSPMGQQAMCRILRLESWGARIVPGRVRAILAGSMKENWDIYNAASTYRQFMMTADRLAAAAVFYGSASYLCQLWNMPGARFLVDVLGTIGAHEIAADLIARSGVQRELIESAVKRVAADTAKRKANHKAVEEAVKEMEQIAARVESASAQGPLLSADDKVKLDSIGKSLNKTKPPVTLTMEEIKASGGLEAAKASVPPPPRPKELPPTDAAPAADDTVMVQEVKKRLAAQEPKATDTAVLSEVDTESAVHHAASSAKEALDGGNAAEGKRALGCAKKLGGQHKAALESTEAASASALALVQPAPPAPRRAERAAIQGQADRLHGRRRLCHAPLRRRPPGG
jgi:hypothetical protein